MTFEFSDNKYMAAIGYVASSDIYSLFVAFKDK